VKRTLTYFYFILILITNKTYSQQNDKIEGTISGYVIDNHTKANLQGANIYLIGTKLGTSTDSLGKFVITNVPAGSYSIRASLLGFNDVIKTDIFVSPVKPVELNIDLVESTFNFDEVEVTAQYFQKSPDLPISNQTQSYEEIRRLPGGFEDVVRAVSILPGVAQVQAGRNDLIVRGGAPSENLYVIDNIEVPNINHFGTQGASGGPLSYVNLDFVNTTSFSSGGFGVRYGDKLSSVLSIDLRDGRKDAFGGKATIAATQFGLNLEGPISEKGAYLFSARRSYLDFIFKGAGFGFVPEYWDFMTKANYDFGGSDRISIVGIAALDNVRLFNDTEKKRLDNARILYSKQNQGVVGIMWRHLFSSGYSTVTLSQLYTDYRYRQNDTLMNPIFTNNSFEREWSLRGDITYEIVKTTELSFGIQGKIIGFNSNLILPTFESSYGNLISVNSSFDTTALKASGYIQLSHGFERFRLTIGARADHFNLIAKSFVIAPRLSATVMLSPITNINASVGRYYQSPSYIWLVSNPVNRQLRYIGVNQFVLGIDHLLRSDTKVSLEGYIKKYSDYPASTTQTYLVLANTGAGFGGSTESFASFGLDPLISAGSGNTFGVELFLQKKLSEIPCYGILSLSYNQSKFKALDGVSRPSSFDQRWIMNLGGGYLFNEKWEISTKFRLATGRPYTPYNPDGSQTSANYNGSRLGVNHSLDVRADRRWMFSSWTLITYVDIQNIYNRKPIDVPRYNNRTKKIEQSNAIGILPSIGISAEF
jgi:hypothetical protein